MKPFAISKMTLFLLLGIVCLNIVYPSFAQSGGSNLASPSDDAPFPAAVTTIMNDNKYDHAGGVFWSKT
jgi:hypothetical protein